MPRKKKSLDQQQTLEEIFRYPQPRSFLLSGHEGCPWHEQVQELQELARVAFKKGKAT